MSDTRTPGADGGLTEVDQDFVRERVSPHFLEVRVPLLEDLATRTDQTWKEVAARHGATDRELPPWKVNVDGLCDALDDAACTKPEAGTATFVERRNEEDVLLQERYRDLPYPESQLVAVAHTLVARGILGESELAERLEKVRRRLAEA